MNSLRAIFSHKHAGERLPAGRGRSAGERRQGERRGNVYPLAGRDTRVRAAVRAAGFGIYEVDCASGQQQWSPELKAMAGLPEDAAPLPAGTAAALLHPDDRDGFEAALQASFDPGRGGDFQHEFRLLRPDGGTRWIKASGCTFFAGDGDGRRPLVATGIFMDMTGRRAAEQVVSDSRAALAGLIDAVIDAIISIDAEQRIVLFNPAACRMFQCTSGEAIGSPLERFIPERARQAHREHVRRFAEAGVTARTMGEPGVFSGLRADGQEFPIEASIAKVRVDGHTRLTVIVRDISKRKEAEDALRRSQQDLELAVHGADMGIWCWNMRNGEMMWSERCRELFGLSAEEPISYERFLAALHPDDRERTEVAVREASGQRREFNIEYRTLWTDGSIHCINAVGRCFYDDDSGKPLRMSGLVLDITERKRVEQALRRLNEELEERIQERTSELVLANEALVRSNLELQQFAYIAAHDLQTPLRSVISFTQLLARECRGRISTQADLWLEQVQRSGQRMSELIQDLLAYSRVDSSGAAFRPTDIRVLFDDVVAELATTIRESGATVTCGELPVVTGDRTQLAQVLQNLIGNALKYHGGRPPEIHVSAERQAGGWLFSVRDRGIGIAPRHRERIFDVFQRLHSQQEYPGTGIGLAICRRVVHRHGGRIWVEAADGEGSVFRFTLPDQESRS